MEALLALMICPAQPACPGVPDRGSAWRELSGVTRCVSHIYLKLLPDSPRQCFCGNALNRSARTEESDCSCPCTGAKREACGGSQRLSVYKKSVSTTPAIPTSGALATDSHTDALSEFVPESAPVVDEPATFATLS